MYTLLIVDLREGYLYENSCFSCGRLYERPGKRAIWQCAYFLIVDTDTMKFEPITNPAMGMAGGAGPQAVNLLSSRGVSVILTGMVGPNAKSALDAAKIVVVMGVSGSKSVKDVVDEYLKK